MEFKCEQCGVCCMVAVETGMVPKNKDGTACKFLNLETNLCTIYENRPDFCNVDYMINFVYINNGLTKEKGIEDTMNLCKEARGKILCGKQFQQ